MPKAVDSNNTSMPEIHPITLIEECFRDLSDSLQAFKAVVRNSLETNENPGVSSVNINGVLDEIIERFNRQRKQIRVLLKPLANSLPAKPNVKAVRDKFIFELLEQGFTHEQISQALNLRLSAINKIITQTENKTDIII